MRKIKLVLVFVISGIVFTACSDTGFKKTKGGMPYKLYPGDGKKIVKKGSYLKVNLIQKKNDSVLYDSHDKLPIYIPVTDFTRPYDPTELFLQLKSGDSLVTVQMIDSFMKQNPESIPPFFKKGDRLVTILKVVDILPDETASQQDEMKEKENLLQREIKTVEDYLSKNKINARKTGRGTFVETLDPGQGPAVDSGKTAMVKYKGTTFGGKIFDTNFDSTFGHTDPYPVNIGAHGVIPGLEEGLLTLKQGGHAKIYIPSMLAYGPTPNPGGAIKPFDDLIMEVYVTEVKNQPPPQTMPNSKVDTTQRRK